MYITDCHHKSGHAITKSFSLGLTILCTGKAYYSEQDQQQLLQLQCSVEIFKTKIFKTAGSIPRIFDYAMGF